MQGAAALVEATASGSHGGLLRITCNPTNPASAPCIVIMDACHTATDSGSCKHANLSLAVNTTTSAVSISASILMGGGLSGRSPLGGVYIYLAATLSVSHYITYYLPPFLKQSRSQATAVNGTLSNPTAGVWYDTTLSACSNNGSTCYATTSTVGNLGAYVNFGASNPTGAVQVAASFFTANFLQSCLCFSALSRRCWLGSPSALSAKPPRGPTCTRSRDLPPARK
jgi:hypothetical protein